MVCSSEKVGLRGVAKKKYIKIDMDIVYSMCIIMKIRIYIYVYVRNMYIYIYIFIHILF